MISQELKLLIIDNAEAIAEILRKGNHAEIHKNNGNIRIFEVKKKTVK